jgi:triosephosphate isomerase (TIM)
VARKKLLVANWKLNHTRASARDFFAAVLAKPLNTSVDLAVAPVAPMLGLVCDILSGQTSLALAAQNVFYADTGAYTGEWSALQLAELSVKYCIVGHSERRSLFFETDAQVAKKVDACLKAAITPIICVGESEEQRVAHQTESVITRQVVAVLEGEHQKDRPLVFAYEPIWAIGTGKTATALEAQTIHQLIRSIVAGRLSKDHASQCRILYGGSVNGSNIREIASMPDIDGALVGGASLQAASFLSMVEELQGV